MWQSAKTARERSDTYTRFCPKFVNVLGDFIIDLPESRFEKRLNTLIEANKQHPDCAGPPWPRSFSYKGSIYPERADKQYLQNKRLILQESLHPQMEALLLFQRRIKTDEALIKSMLRNLVSSTKDIADYYTVLPESIHKDLDITLAGLPCKDLIDTRHTDPNKHCAVHISSFDQQAIDTIKAYSVWSMVS